MDTQTGQYLAVELSKACLQDVPYVRLQSVVYRHRDVIRKKVVMNRNHKDWWLHDFSD